MQSRYDRQSFLGSNSQQWIESVKVGIAGLGGGGSHSVQQLAHIGFKKYVLCDFDVVEDTNLNRLIGAQVADVAAQTPKLEIAKRMIVGLQPDAQVDLFSSKWQANLAALKDCNIIFGCLETFTERKELEQFCRRYLIHYIDIGMDVLGRNVVGQIIKSSPGMLCMACMGFITEAPLAEEGRRYGNVGGRPQVVWPNGVLASTAVGFAVDVVTGYTDNTDRNAYLCYDGVDCTLKPPVTRKTWPSHCVHFENQELGNPTFKTL